MISDKNMPSFFPIRHNNHFRLLINAEQFYPAIIDAINQAHTEILIENYLTISGKVLSRFISALLLAAKRGVKVYCLFDSYGSKGILPSDLALLRTKNIQIQFYNRIKYQHYLRNLFRDHRKIFIIDREHAFIGGAGLSDQFDTKNQHSWHDIMLSIKGEIVTDWFLLFQKNWSKLNNSQAKNSNYSSSNNLEQDDLASNFTLDYSPIQFSEKQTGQVITFTIPHIQEIKKHLLHEINKSKNIIWLTTPYFVPSRKLRRALIRAAKRGVNVKLLLPGKITDHPGVRIMGQRYYAQLLRHHIQIFEFSLHFSHAKVLLCDQWCTTGSSNFDRWNFKWNLEANQTISDPNFSKTMKRWFEGELNECNEISYEQWRNRSLWQRTKEWFWGVIVQLLESLKRPKN